MCGIAGYLGPPRRVDSTTLLQALSARGPDGDGLLHANGNGWSSTLVHRRLAIINPTPTAAQPMEVPGECALVFNGEIFNHAEIRPELEKAGVVFRGTGDTEVVMHGLRLWGEALLPKLRGPFALAFLDRRSGTLLLARDRLGINPLYVTDVPGGGFAFSSTVDALLKAGLVERELELRALCGLLFFGSVPEPHGLWKGVRELGPGQVMTVDANGHRTQRTWWRLPAEDPAADADAHRIQEALLDAVIAEQVSDVPVALLLSSGLDSAAVASLVARGGNRPTAFTVGFPTTGSAVDESALAAQTAEALGLNHKTVLAPADDGVDALTRALAAQDLPSMDGTNTFLVSRAIAMAGYKVALSGLGGDELFLGYANRRNFHRFRRMIGPRAPLRLAANTVETLRALGAGLKQERAVHAALRLRGDAGAYAAVRCVAGPATVLAMIHPDLRSQVRDEDLDPTSYLDASHLPVDGDGALSRLELRHYLRWTLLKDANQLSLANGVELRVPMMDWRLVEAVLAIPGHLRAKGMPPKPLLRAALQGVLPAGIEKRPKLGFVLPLQEWLEQSRHNAPRHISTVLSEHATQAPFPLSMTVAAVHAWEKRIPDASQRLEQRTGEWTAVTGTDGTNAGRA